MRQNRPITAQKAEDGKSTDLPTRSKRRGSTLDASEERDVLQLIRHLRRSAPNAAIVFVMWPSQAQLSNRLSERMVRGFAAREHVDVASASAMLDAAARVFVSGSIYA